MLKHISFGLIRFLRAFLSPQYLFNDLVFELTYGWTARNCPLCPYPKVARYEGIGSIDEAPNFTCVTIVPATVDIKQVNLKVGKGSFAAKMAVPESYNFTNKKEIGSVVSKNP